MRAVQSRTEEMSDSINSEEAGFEVLIAAVLTSR
jgi:hypothetical protein